MQGTLKEILEAIKGWDYTLFINDMEIHRPIMSDDIYRVVKIEKDEINKEEYMNYRTDINIKLELNQEAFDKTYNLKKI